MLPTALLLTLSLAQAAAPAPEVFERLPLASLRQERARTGVEALVAGTRLRLAPGFESDEGLSLWVREGDQRAHLPPAELAQGAVRTFPGGSVRFRNLPQGRLGAAPADGGPGLDLPWTSLLERVHQDLPKARLDLVEYALAWEDETPGLPAALGLLRRDRGGRYFAAFHTAEALRKGTVWLVAVNGILYGARLEGPDLLLLKRPSDAKDLVFDPSERPLQNP